jgi:hypothetical protein
MTTALSRDEVAARNAADRYHNPGLVDRLVNAFRRLFGLRPRRPVHLTG